MPLLKSSLILLAVPGLLAFTPREAVQKFDMTDP
jgi:hypothetical protein